MGDALLDYAAVVRRFGETPTLLLGNGFSIAYSKDFGYTGLRKLAKLPPEVDDAFDALGTTNFEELLRWFSVSQRILGRFDLLAGVDDELVAYERRIRSAMMNALTNANPHSFADMKAEERTSARAFLQPYGNVFTLCYDLLLYWLAVDARKADAFRPQDKGAFRWDERSTCEVYWLHGGFHLYEQGNDTYKVVQRGAAQGTRATALLGKIEANINAGIVPLIVAEGEPEQKWTAISRNKYLRIALQRLTSTEGTIVTLGASFEQDDHIVDAIVRGSADQLLIGTFGPRGAEQFAAQYGDLSQEREQWTRASGLPKRELRTAFWDTRPHVVWGRPPLPRTTSIDN